MLKTEAKVGLFSLVALVALFSIFMWLNGSKLFQKGYELEAEFNEVSDLRPGAAVKFIGVDVGRVSRIYFEEEKVVVTMRIKPDIKLPSRVKALISSAGIVGDKYISLNPVESAKELQQFHLNNQKRIPGEPPITLDQFFALSYDLMVSFQGMSTMMKSLSDTNSPLESLKKSVASIEKITANVEEITAKLNEINFAKMAHQVEETISRVTNLMQKNEPMINEILAGVNRATLTLTDTCQNINQFMKTIDNEGATATSLKETLASTQKIAANLEKFTTVLANKDNDLGLIVDDARKTVTAINNLVENMNTAVKKFTGGESDLGNLQSTLTNAGHAVNKITNYVNKFEKMSSKAAFGANYNNQQDLRAGFKWDFNLNENQGVRFRVDDIGAENLTTLQLANKPQQITYRAGLYQNKFGIGCDLSLNQKLSWNLNLWDTKETKLGLNADWELNDHLHLTGGAATNLNNNENSFDLGCWWHF